eukprot:scaffold1469_cov119-Cylindrotheca_fusiformis.AAC.21
MAERRNDKETGDGRDASILKKLSEKWCHYFPTAGLVGVILSPACISRLQLFAVDESQSIIGLRVGTKTNGN